MTPSGVSSALYRFPINVANIGVLRSTGLTDGTIYRLAGQAIVTYQRPDNNANQLWLQDATGGIVTYDLNTYVTTDYNIGDGVTGLTGTLSLYNQLLEFIPMQGADPGAATSTGNVITPLPRTLATLSTADESMLASIPQVSFTSPTGNFVALPTAQNYPITDPTGAGVFRTLLSEADYIGTAIPTTPQNMIALVGRFGTTMQITPRYSADITPYTPAWTSGWPKAEDASQTVFSAKVNINMPGTAYYVVLLSGAPAPTSAQVKAGQDATGTVVAANLAGTIACAAGSTEYVSGVTGLAPSTTYNVYFVAEAYGNLQAAPVMKIVTTTTGGTAPVIISPTATSRTINGAILGGNITSDGGSAITARGTVWKAGTGVTLTDHNQVASGTSTGIFTDARTGMPSASQIYYAAYATNGIGTTLTTETSFYTLDLEATNHVTAFAAGTTTTSSIPLTWTDATGAILPVAYLIKGSTVSFEAITDPIDGTPEASSGLVQNVNQGVGAYTFTGLSIGTPYYFKIYPYTGSNATVNYKTSVTVPQVTATTQSAGVYTWSGADLGLWTVATNWTPTRTTPAANDIIQFSDGTTKTITGVPATETIGQLVLSGTNTIVNLQSSAAAVLTIAGLTGADLVVPATCALNLNGTGAITLALSAPATGSIDGSMTFSSTATTAHRLIPAAAGAIVFHNGASFTAGLNFGGNPFGTTATTLNSIIFESGSTYYHQSGSNPFGATQPSSIVTFLTGSLYKVIGPVTPGYSGRTYANLEYDYPTGVFTQTGSAKVSMDNLTITNGTVNFGVTGTPGHSIKGNISVASGAVLNFNPNVSGTPTAGTVNLNGLSAQTISGSGRIMGSALSTIEVNNSAGVTLNANDSINGTLTLTSGLFTLGTGNLTFGPTGVLSGTPSATNMIVATNSGELRKPFTATGSYTFPVGDNTGTAEYSPVTINFTTGTFAAGAYAGVNLKNQAFLGVSGNHISRYWNLTSSGITDFTCDAQFNYVPADVVGTESQIYCFRVDPTVDPFDVANTTLHQLTASGLTSLGTFTGRPALTKTLDIKAYLEGYFKPNGYMERSQGNTDNSPAGAYFIFTGTDANIADTLTVLLAEDVAPGYNYVYEVTGVKLDTLGNMSVPITSAFFTGNYYIVLKHRNHLETWSATTVNFSGTSPVSYDFTDAQNKAYGTPGNMKSKTSVAPAPIVTVWTLYGGDIYEPAPGPVPPAGTPIRPQDGNIEQVDLNPVYNKNVTFKFGYIFEDLTGDGYISQNDLNVVYNNNVKFVVLKSPRVAGKSRR
jgi:hypothetical protein